MGKPTKSEHPKFTKGDDPVFRDDFDAVIDVLKGPSRWKRFICPNVIIAQNSGKDEPSGKFKDLTFRIDSSEDLERDAHARGYHLPKDAAAFTAKTEGKIFMLDWQGTHATYLLAALHECVHLVSDPASQGTKVSTASHYLSPGLLEGLVEAVAEDILSSQNIPLPRNDKGHVYRLAIVRELMCVSFDRGRKRAIRSPQDLDLWGYLLFQGNPRIIDQMPSIYSYKGWEDIKNLAWSDGPENARKAISFIKSVIPTK
jgi:hypothetical protein